MAELCMVCRSRPEYEELARLALGFDEDLRARFSQDQLGSGGVLFLGRHYAHSDTLLFTLNPGLDTDRTGSPRPIDRRLFDYNLHWEGGRSRYRNWTFSRHLFRHMIDAAPWFQSRLEVATDAFIVPWRSRNWSDLVRAGSWQVVSRYSRAVFSKMVEHHKPGLIFTSGKTTLDLLWSFLGVPKPKPVDLRHSLTNRNFKAEWYQLDSLKVGEQQLERLEVFRLPHFSRGGYDEFAAIGEWVGTRLPRVGAAR